MRGTIKARIGVATAEGLCEATVENIEYQAGGAGSMSAIVQTLDYAERHQEDLARLHPEQGGRGPLKDVVSGRVGVVEYQDVLRVREDG